MASQWMTILASTIGGLIVILLGIIGYLTKTGFDQVLREIRDIWEWAKSSDNDRKWIHEQIATIKAKCEERHEK